METQNQSEPQSNNPIIPEVVKEETALVRPSAPVTVDELAALEEGRGLEIVETRHKIIQSLRRASIMLASPQDLLLFKTDEGAVTAFLQDSGCKRIMPLWGIDITPKNGFVRIANEETPGEFAYECMADGFCNATQSFVKDITGVRYSTEHFCKDLPALQKEVRVKQASVANRDGNIVRALTGMKNIAIEEILSVWKGTDKKIELCSYGKGFGSKAERQGAGGTAKGTPTDVQPPICEICNKTMKFVSGEGKTYESFWACPDKKKIDGKWNEHSSINDKKYREGLAKSQQRDPGMEG